MARRKCGLLIIVCLCFSAGCVVEAVDAFIPEPSLPIAVRIQDSWSDAPLVGNDGSTYSSEREIILSCVEEWNEMISPRLKESEPLPLEFAGFAADTDFEVETDLSDGHSVIYKIPVMTPEFEKVFDMGGYGELSVAGYGLFGSDALVFTGEFVNYTSQSPQPDAIPRVLRHIACHELGHVLGLQHQFVLPGVMNDSIPWYKSDESGYQVRDADVDEFCLAHPDSCQ